VTKEIERDINKDSEFSHSVINYVNATYQGRFAYHNILLQLQNQPYLEGRIDESKQALAKVTEWLKALWDQNPIFSFTPNYTHAQEADHALSLLAIVRDELIELATNVQNAIKDQNATSRSEQLICELIASVGRFAYSRDNYLRGFVELAKFRKDQETKGRFEEELKQSDQDVQLAHSLLKHFKTNAASPGAAFYSALFSEAIPLPGIFRSYVHDIRQLLAIFEGGFTYLSAGITENESRAWKDIGISPLEAGYWLAYGIDAQGALKWNQLGITNYRVAGLWTAWSFPPDVAVKWLKAGYIPRLAGPWIRAGFELEEASNYINQGITLPEMIPPQQS